MTHLVELSQERRPRWLHGRVTGLRSHSGAERSLSVPRNGLDAKEEAEKTAPLLGRMGADRMHARGA